jgi:hypothetical protein
LVVLATSILARSIQTILGFHQASLPEHLLTSRQQQRPHGMLRNGGTKRTEKASLSDLPRIAQMKGP